MKDIETSCLITATSEKVWKLWTDVDHASLWDTDVKEVNLFGDFVVGTKGICKLKNGLNLYIQFSEITPNKSYNNLGKLLGIKMEFFHVLEKVNDNQVKVTHSVQFLGAFRFLYKPLLKKLLKPALETALLNFKKLAQS